MQKIIPCLWFDGNAEEAAKFYTSIFKNSKIRSVIHYGKAGQEIHGQPEGRVLEIEFELDGQIFRALNGGPVFKFNEAVSFVVDCSSQEELDSYWEKLSEGGDPKAQQCGWLKDKFGLSWQIVPENLRHLFQDREPEKKERAFTAMLGMKKIDIETLERAYAGSEEVKTGTSRL